MHNGIGRESPRLPGADYVVLMTLFFRLYYASATLTVIEMSYTLLVFNAFYPASDVSEDTKTGADFRCIPANPEYALFWILSARII